MQTCLVSAHLAPFIQLGSQTKGGVPPTFILSPPVLMKSRLSYTAMPTSQPNLNGLWLRIISQLILDCFKLTKLTTTTGDSGKISVQNL